jgi:hypothetical protein
MAATGRSSPIASAGQSQSTVLAGELKVTEMRGASLRALLFCCVAGDRDYSTSHHGNLTGTEKTVTSAEKTFRKLLDGLRKR